MTTILNDVHIQGQLMNTKIIIHKIIDMSYPLRKYPYIILFMEQEIIGGDTEYKIQVV